MEIFGFELNCDAKDKNNLIGIGEWEIFFLKQLLGKIYIR